MRAAVALCCVDLLAVAASPLPELARLALVGPAALAVAALMAGGRP